MSTTLKYRIGLMILAASMAALTACTVFSQLGGQGIAASDAQTEAPTETQATTEVATEATAASTEASDLVRAKATTRVPIRLKPGATCPIIGWVEEGQIIHLTRRNLSDPDYWYETDFLGPDHLGWVYHKPFDLLRDDSPLERIRIEGCGGPTETPAPAASAPPAVEVCGPGWLPASGCTCCTSTLVCADGTVAQFNPQCMGGPQPKPGETCGCEGYNYVCRVDGKVSSQETCSSSCGCVK